MSLKRLGFVVFVNSLWTHLFEYTQRNPVWKNESHQEQQHPEGHASDQQKRYNTKNAHLVILLVNGVKVINKIKRLISLLQKIDRL